MFTIACFHKFPTCINLRGALKFTPVHHSPTYFFPSAFTVLSNNQPMCHLMPRHGFPKTHKHIECCNWLVGVNSEGKSPGSFLFPRVLFSTHSTHFWKVRRWELEGAQTMRGRGRKKWSNLCYVFLFVLVWNVQKFFFGGYKKQKTKTKKMFLQKSYFYLKRVQFYFFLSKMIFFIRAT